MVCGDGATEGTEACDDGILNGTYDNCDATCTGPGESCPEGSCFACTGGTCTNACNDSGGCVLQCPPDATYCAIDGSGAGSEVTLLCAENATCSFDCTGVDGDGDWCIIECAPGATCIYSCDDVGGEDGGWLLLLQQRR